MHKKYATGSRCDGYVLNFNLHAPTDSRILCTADEVLLSSLDMNRLQNFTTVAHLEAY